MASSSSTTPIVDRGSDAGKGRPDDPTPGPVGAVCVCSFCEDACKGPLDSKRFIEEEMELWRVNDERHNPKFDHDDRDDWTALQWAAAGGHDGVVQFILNGGSKPNGMVKGRDGKLNVMLSGRDGLTALHLAARGGHTIIVLALLHGGMRAHVNDQSKAISDTPLHLACEGGHMDVEQMLLSNDPKAEVNVKGWNGITPLHLACKGGHIDVVQALLSNDPKAEVNVKTLYGNTPLHLACEGGHIDVVQALLSNDPKAEVNVEVWNRITPLHLACGGGHIHVVQALLSNDPKAEVNVKGRNGNTPLHLACKGGHIDVVQALLSNDPKAEVNVKGWNGDTPLHLACEGGHIDVVQVLLSNIVKAGIKAKTRLGYNPIYLAYKHVPEGVEALLITHPETVIHHIGEVCEEINKVIWQDLIKLVGDVISKHIGEDNFQRGVEIAHNLPNGSIWQELIQKAPIKNYLEVLYRDRQAYVDAANAILVGAALIASVTFGSWLQPPLNYTLSQSSLSMSPPSSYDPNYVDLEHSVPLRGFWVFNCLSFYFAIATVVFGACSVLPRKRLFIQQTVIKLRRNLLVTSILLGCSVLFVTIAFGIAGCIVLAPIIKFQLYMIVPTCIGGIVCLFSLCVLFKNILDDLVSRMVDKASPKNIVEDF